MKTTLSIRGMSCASCASHVEKALLRVPGVVAVAVNFARGQATVQHREGTDVSALENAVVAAGYSTEVCRADRSVADERHVQERTFFRRFLVAALFTAPLIIQMPAMLIGSDWQLPAALQFALATVVQFWCGWQFYLGTWTALRHWNANMDTLIVMGTSAAYLFSVAVWLLGLPAHLYFESSASIISLVLFGRWLEARSKHRASEAIEKLLHLQSTTARVVRDDGVVEVAIDEIVVDDLVEVLAGDNIPVDGVVVEGVSTVDESMLTGESAPVTKKESEGVFSGSVNHDGTLRIRVQKVGAETALAAIARLVAEAQGSKADVQRLADRVSGIFVPIVLLVSAVTLIGWIASGASAATAVINAVAVLVVACPCALGLATPTVIMVASGVGAGMGILFRDANAVERACELDTIIFDKTGTLTVGRPTVQRVIPHADDDLEYGLAMAGAMARHSRHPLSKAIVDYVERQAGKPLEVDTVKTIAGKGISAEVDGKTFMLGSVRWANEHGVVALLENEAADAVSKTLLWSDGVAIAEFHLSDEIRASAKETVRKLERDGVHCLMLTGDHTSTAAAVAQAIGMKDFRAEVLPEDKIAVVRQLQDTGASVGMVGDGINDAPALAAATVGFAVGAGSDIAKEASDVTLVRSDPVAVLDAVRLSGATMRKIRQNLFFAFVYNVLGIPLAAVGLLNPIVAAAAMSMSSVSVVSNALLLRRFR